jgi:heme a synthase
MTETADRLVNDKTVLKEADFNATRTWVEYGNRIVGVIIGFLIFALSLASIKFWRNHRALTVVSFLTLLLVGFQGWLGSFVVSTNLTPWVVTIHMFLALVIVALLVYLINRSSENNLIEPVAAQRVWWLVACIAVLIVQILLGTQVREHVDLVASTYPRVSWLESVGQTFRIHRSFSWIVLILHTGLIFNLWKSPGAKSFSLALILLILSTILTGAGMAYFGVPPFLQPVHLLLATVSFGMQFLLLLRLKGNVTYELAG